MSFTRTHVIGARLVRAHGEVYLVKELLAGGAVEDSELQLGVHGGNANIYLSETH